VSTSGQSGRKRKAQKSELLTSSPFKKVLEEQAERTKIKADRQSIKSARKHAANKKARKTDKKSTKTDKSGQGRRPSKAKSKKRDNCNSNYAETDTETCCLVCGENFSEEWIQCNKITDGHTLSVQL